jgi:predicted metal-dependent hydrolase
MTIPIPREPAIDLSNVPRHWVDDNAAATAISNGLNLLFPIGERFFVRSVNRFARDIVDPELRAQIRAFFRQEGHHASAHDDFNDLLRAHGFEIDGFLSVFERVIRRLEATLPARIALASTAAAEHFTAILAEGAFSHGVLDALHPQVRELLAWHAAEEIEHKSVAFDVLRAIDPSHTLRMSGLALATLTLGGFWLAASIMLLRQERLGLRGTLRELARMRRRDPIMRRVFWRGIRQYMRRDFHPSANANEHLARDWFAARGLAFMEAA